MDLLLATHNPHKIREISEILNDHPVNIRTLRDYPELKEIPETGDSFEANALIKARACYQHTGLLSLADDSGLEVDVLNGAPGIYSARYAGIPHDYAANNRKLLNALNDIPEKQRTARFHCVLALVGTTDRRSYAEHCFHGVCEGLIIHELRGDHGFGYDPLFYIPELGKTMAELPPEIKNRISHRAHALKKFRNFWNEWAKQ